MRRLTYINYGNVMIQQYGYDSADRINEMIVMQGSLNQIDLKYQYDRVGRLTAVNDNGKWFTYQYDEIGRLINQQNGVNGINSEYSYYPSGNVKSLRHYNGSEIVASYEYQYDLRGNQIQKDEGANTSRYYYDALSRIKVAELPNEITQNYEYDDLNNIKEIAEIKGTQIAQTNFTYDHNSRLLLSETVNGDDLKQLRFEYDAEGNQTYKEEVEKQSGNLIASEAYNFWYNGYNQLSRVKDPNGDFIEYTYNAQGLRTKKDFIDHATNYIYDRGNIVLESDQDYMVTAKNIRGLQLIYRETGDETLYYLHNAHGDVTKLLNDKGWVIKDYDYDPFGREEAAPIKAFGGDVATEIWRNETQQIDNPFRYCGEYLDAETGNYYLRARYYDPEARRFTTEDSYRGDINKPLSLNGFTYCENNPIKFVDPSGFSAATAEWSANQYVYLHSIIQSDDPNDPSDDGVVAWAWAQLIANNVYVDENGTVFTNDEVWEARQTVADRTSIGSNKRNTINANSQVSKKSNGYLTIGIKTPTDIHLLSPALIIDLDNGALGVSGSVGPAVGISANWTPGEPGLLVKYKEYLNDFYVIGGNYELHMGFLPYYVHCRNWANY